MHVLLEAVRATWKAILSFYWGPVTPSHTAPSDQPAEIAGLSIFGARKQCAHPTLRPHRRIREKQ